MAEHTTVTSDGRLCWMPPDMSPSSTSLSPWDDSKTLADRGDFFGLLGLLALMREASAQFDLHALNICAHRLYRTLPVVLRCPWIKPDVDLLLECIDTMLAKVRSFPFRVAVDWETFRWAIDNPHATIPDALIRIGPHVRRQPRPFPLLDEVTPWRYGRMGQPWKQSKPGVARGSHLLGQGMESVF